MKGDRRASTGLVCWGAVGYRDYLWCVKTLKRRCTMPTYSTSDQVGERDCGRGVSKCI